MKGDRLFCVVCEKYSVDIQDLYDSRNGGRPRYGGKSARKIHYVWNCPYCKCNILANVNQIIIDNILMIAKKDNNYKGSKLYQRFIKDWPSLQKEALYTLSHSILLEESNDE